MSKILQSVGFTLALLVAGATGASAQAVAPGWSVNITPYLWLPTISGTVNYALPANVGGSTSVDTKPSDYLKGLNFAGMLTGEVRYDRFSVLADLMYVNVGNESSRLRTFNVALLPSNPISTSGTLNTSSRVGAGIWSLAGTYTVLQGDWGKVDALAGIRLVTIDAKTNYNASVTFTGPRGGTATFFGPGGGLSTSSDVWNGIVGVRGRFPIGTSGFFIPIYFDVGAGGSDLTWQTAGGVGYQTGRVDLSVGWRYLSFDQGSSSVVKNLALNGPYLAASFKF